MSYDEYTAQLESALQSEQQKNMEMNRGISSFMQQPDQNLIEYQLELDNVLERIEHLLKGDRLKFDKDGNMAWEPEEDDSKKPFNELGVQEILRTLAMYLNRNLILSNYDEDTIKERVHDIGYELNELVFMRYEEYGLDNSEKIKLYPIIITEVVHSIEAAYLRALFGGERESLRTARMVTQSQPLGNFSLPKPQKKFSLFKPQSWLGGLKT